MEYRPVLSIAGSDSGGCAGIQADIKSISACGGFACTALTALTAQNTQGVNGVFAVPPAFLGEQMDAVCNDIDIKAVKIGMLHSAEVINRVAEKLTAHRLQKIVLDPVMVATSGDPLISPEAIDALKRILPQASLITPNIPEAELLLGETIARDTMEAQARKMGQTFQTAVLLKGGHLPQSDTMLDVLYDLNTDSTHRFENPYSPSNNTHGTGCSLSSAIATYLAHDLGLVEAVDKGITFVAQGIRSGADKNLGKGHGPIDFFWRQNQKA
ncbi:bifunctional hydroxymethylpyrimidine kinase/phosphomethylpyrimidine kinase [Sediminicola luteus]|uniref:hydroxymethylpyrimidine kinase n=1 Tax=Sediminicola luteus TaxID=319238 RepID=A0A2A4G3X6_9FLAO|nr:bifunctional hydroxymethylpyrimidine kinase/phosphomethylpyrimidine kinase [Sediminicola luteus]PCE63141.1 bifunctional hydroxymethylpyrimidine kinase/phosphomethylpyrimidine kinase [Sediminicola luteus]